MSSSPKRRSISQRSELVYDAHSFGIIIDTREIFVSPNTSESHDTAMIDHVVCNNFIKNLQILNNMSNETILIHMATCGGSWNYGIAMYDAIKASCEDKDLSDIVILSYAHAQSMSSVIPQAATWRVLMPNTEYLVHYGDLSGDGNYLSVMSDMNWAKKQTDDMIEIYVDRMKDGNFFIREGMDKSQIREWLIDKIDKKQEFYMTAREAVDKGFADAILGDDGYESISKLQTE